MRVIGSETNSKCFHAIVRKRDLLGERFNVSPECEGLQLAMLRPPAGKRYAPHYHHYSPKETERAQESWVVISGEVRVTFFDTEGNVVCVDTLHEGDVSITYRGGHAYEIMRDDTLVYEYKTGPYLGQSKDKRFFND